MQRCKWTFSFKQWQIEKNKKSICSNRSQIRNKLRDTISYSDYVQEKKNFYSKFKTNSNFCNFDEEIIVKDLKKHYLIPIMGKDPCTINIYIFYLFYYYYSCTIL